MLVGAVLAGQELIEQSKISKTIKDLQSYATAVNTFKSKFNAIPGDFSKASKFSLNKAPGSSTPNVCSTSYAPTQTGNGNGNGILENAQFADSACAANTSIDPNPFWYNGEIFNFFVILSNSQLIKESLTEIGVDVGNGAANNPAVGLQFPEMPIGNGVVVLPGYSVHYWVLGIPKSFNTNFNATRGASLTPAQAHNIDSKIDDANPLTGSIQSVSNYNSASTTIFLLFQQVLLINAYLQTTLIT